MALIALDGLFMRFDVNNNFFENDIINKYPATYKCGLSVTARLKVMTRRRPHMVLVQL